MDIDVSPAGEAPIPDPKDRARNVRGWLGWKLEKKSCFLIVIGLSAFALCLAGMIALISYLYL